MVTIKTYRSPAEAQLDKNLLEISGVQAFIQDENSYAIGYGNILEGIRLQVDNSDEQKAQSILSQPCENQLPDDFESEETFSGAESFQKEEGVQRGYPAWPLVVITLVLIYSVLTVIKNSPSHRPQQTAEQTTD